MADNAVFEWVCAEIEGATDLNHLEARGTVRIALRGAGLDGRSVSCEQMKVLLEKVLSDELARRSVEQPDALCKSLAVRIERQALDAFAGDTPEGVFARLAGTS